MANKSYTSPVKRFGASFSPSKKIKSNVTDCDIGQLKCGPLDNVRLTGFVAEIFGGWTDTSTKPFLKIALQDTTGHIVIWIHHSINRFQEMFRLLGKYVVTIQSGDLKPGRMSDYGDQFYEASIAIKEMEVIAVEGTMNPCSLLHLVSTVLKFHHPVAYGRVEAEYQCAVGDVGITEICSDCQGKLQEDPDEPDEYFCAKCQKNTTPSGNPMYDTFQITLRDDTETVDVAVFHNVAVQLFGKANRYANPCILEGKRAWMIRKQYKRINGTAQTTFILCGTEVVGDLPDASSVGTGIKEVEKNGSEDDSEGYSEG